MQNVLLQSALDYALKGYSVIPVGVNKRPLVKWERFQQERADETQIKKWWQDSPHANIGIVTGEISGITVIDFEVQAGELWKQYPETLTIRTGGGGVHLWYKYEPGVKNSAKKLAEFVDVRGEGGYVLAPPSLHASGNHYSFIGDPNVECQPFPTEVLKQIKKRGASIPLEQSSQGAEDGQRNQTAASYLGSLLRTELFYQPGQVWSTLQNWNAARVNPPMAEEELRGVFNSIYEAEKGRRENGDIRLLFKSDRRAAIQKTAQILAEQFHVKTIGGKIPDLMIYDNGKYRLGLREIRQAIENLLGEIGTNNIKNEILKKIEDQTVAQREDFIVDKKWINLQTGIFNLETKEFTEHNPKFLFLHQLPIEYNPEADCPTFKNFLTQVLQSDQIPIIQEWFGYCLYRTHVFKKGIIFVGEKDTGKTTLIKILENFLGEENTSGADLQAFSRDKFAMTDLYEKHANIADELKSSDIVDTGKFKKATGESPLKGEYKFGASFNFTSFAKLTFACNKIPSVREIDDDAYFNRWIVIPFLNRIEKPDLNLKDKIYAERSGIFNYALEGLDRLLKQERFSYNLSVEETRELMTRYGSVVARFVYDCLEEAYDDETAWITKDEMHRAFQQYARKNKEHTMGSKTAFGKELQAIANYISDGNAKINNENTRVWRYVKFKNNLEKAAQAAGITQVEEVEF